jgi:multidrug efflux pump subunit AcrB
MIALCRVGNVSRGLMFERASAEAALASRQRVSGRASCRRVRFGDTNYIEQRVDAVDAISDPVTRIGVPASIHGSFQGAARAFRESLADESCLILAAIAVLYIVPGVLYESYIHPVTILSTLPSAGVGLLLGLMICRTNF